MVLFGLRDKQEVVAGIDIGEDALRIVQLDRTTTPNAVISCISLPWPEGERVILGETDPSTLGSLINRMLDKTGIELQKVSCALPSPSVFTKRIKTPELDWKDLKAHVELEALAVIPPSAGGVQIDFHILRRLGREQFEVLLVAAKQEAVEAMTETMKAADLELVVLDVDSLATQNALEIALPDRLEQTLAVVNMGDGFCTISVRSKGIWVYSGDAPVGIHTFIDSLSDSKGIGCLEVSGLLFDRSTTLREAPEFIQSSVEELALEISRRLSLFWTVAEIDHPFELIVLSGEGASMVGLSDLISEKTGVHSLVLDPLSTFSRRQGMIIDVHPSCFTVATGLALRSSNDRIMNARMEK